MTTRDHTTLHVDCPNCGHPAAFTAVSVVQQGPGPTPATTAAVRDLPARPTADDTNGCNVPRDPKRAKPKAGARCWFDKGHTGLHSWEKPA